MIKDNFDTANANQKSQKKPAQKTPSQKAPQEAVPRGFGHEFKRAMRGYDPDEVDAYVSDLAESARKASRTFEQRMADMKQELAQANRECDNLREKLKEAEMAPPAALPEDTDGMTSEDYERVIASLQNQVTALQSSADGNSDAYAQELMNLRQENYELSQKLAATKAKLDEYGNIEADVARISESQQLCDELTAENKQLKGEISALQDEKAVLESELDVGNKHIQKTEEEAEKVRKEYTRISVENGLLAEKNSQYKEEIVSLKADSKKKAYEYAEKLACREDELNGELIAMRKKLQMQSYHINQADAAVAELANQIAQIKISFGEE